ncbi:MAG: glycerophosphodiester phosphodiesterase [Nocardioides sp.]
MTHPSVLTIAHRGASAYAPENTLAALRTAIEMRCDLAEVDVQRTRDGVLVLVHDTDLRRTTGRRASVSDVTHAELSRLDAGSWFSPVYAGEPVPTLEQAIDVLDGSGTGLLLEVKHPARHPGIATDIARALSGRRGYAESGQCIVQSFDHGVMRDLARQRPDVPIGLLGHPSVQRLPALATWATHVNPRHRRTTAAYVGAVHAAGLSCHAWTVDDEADLRRTLALGVDGVITNRPDVLQRVMSEQLIPA